MESLVLASDDTATTFFTSRWLLDAPVNNITSLVLLFEQEEHARIDIFGEEWLQRYLDYDFFQIFRMSKDTFRKLLQHINHPEIGKVYVGKRGAPVSKEKAVLMTLWYLSKGNQFVVSETFGVAPSTAAKYINFVIDALVNIINEFIVWPKAADLILLEQEFQAICGYPGVIGAIDGCSVKFKAPLNQQDSYIDKNSNHSIKFQAVCTAKKILTNVVVGFPGSVHDARMFRNSLLYRDVMENRRKFHFPEEYHLIGDKAYPLLKWLITPYRHEAGQRRRQLRHNNKHSRTRIVIEHTFGMMKSRWRVLKMIDVNSVQKATQIIAACCVLHNFCLINLDEWLEEAIIEDEIEEVGRVEEADISGARKRNDIAMLL